MKTEKCSCYGDKYIIDSDKLMKGDIILVHGEKIHSRAIQNCTNSYYSHAMLYVGNGSCIESDSKGGVHASNPKRLLMDLEKKFKILRLKNNQGVDYDKIVNVARSEIGKSYSLKNAVNVKLKVSHKQKNRQFCSHLVSEAYRAAGVELANPDECSPATLEKSKLLHVVDGLIRKATAGEIAFALGRNPIKEQTQVLKDCLRRVRDVCERDIQTISDVVDEVVRDKNLDSYITDIFINEGYFDHLEYEKFKNPWRYSREELEAEFAKNGSAFIINIRKAIDMFQKNANRLGDELEKFKCCDAQCPRAFFKCNIELYTELVTCFFEASIMMDNFLKDNDIY